MALTIGELVGYLRLNSTDFDNNLAAAAGSMGDFAVTGQKTGDRAGNSLLKSIGGAALKVGKIVTGAVATVGGIVAGLAIKGGISRQLQIEDAEASLLGLGNSTENVAQIMANAMASVKGTAFGMGEAATTAAGAVAAGIAPGRDLERVLKLVGDSATIAKTDMASMGSVFNKVAASGKLQGDVIAQLQDSGVPVLQMVAKQMGVTAEEAAKMASDGKVSFEIFADAMEAGLGGAALKSGDTTRGAFANMKAAFSRFGVVLTSWFMPLMKTVFNAIGKAVDGLTGVLKPFSEQFGAWFQGKMGPAVEGFGAKAVGWFGKVGDGLGRLKGMFDQVVAGFTLPKVDADGLGGELSGLVKVGYNLRGIFDEVKGGITAFVAGIRDGGNDVTSSGFAGILESIGLAIRNLWDAFGPMAEQAGGIGDIVDAFSPMGIIMAALAPVLPQLAEAAGTLAGVLAGALTLAVEALLPFINDITTGISEIITGFMDTEHGAGILAGTIAVLGAGFLAYKATMAAIAFGTKAWAAAQVILNIAMNLNPVGLIIAGIVALIAIIVLLVMNWDTVVGFLKGVWDGFVGWFMGVMDGFFGWWNGIWNSIMSVVGPIFAAIGSTVSTAWNNIMNVIRVALAVIVTIVSTYINIVLTVITAIWETIKVVFSTAWEIIKTIVATALAILIAVFTGNFDKIGVLIISAWEKIKGHFTAALDAIGGIVSGAWSKITGLFNGAVNGISALLSGAWKAITSTVTNVWNNIIGFFQSIPGRIIAGLVALSGLAARMGSWIGSMKDTAVGKATELVGWFMGLPGMILGALGNLGNLLTAAGSQILQGFLNGLVDGFNAVKEFVGGIGQWIADNKGPKAYDLALLIPAGGWIMKGLEGGIKKSMPSLKNTLGDVSWMISNGIDPELGAGGAYAFSGVGTGSSGVVNTTNFYVYNPVEEASSKTAERKSSQLALVGGI